MKESYQKGVANHLSPESFLDDPRRRGEAVTGKTGRGKRTLPMGRRELLNPTDCTSEALRHLREFNIVNPW